MRQHHEKDPHSFEKVSNENEQDSVVIEALTPDAIIKLKFFDQIINSAVKEGQIDQTSAKLAKFLATATGRTATVN